MYAVCNIVYYIYMMIKYTVYIWLLLIFIFYYNYFLNLYYVVHQHHSFSSAGIHCDVACQLGQPWASLLAGWPAGPGLPCLACPSHHLAYSGNPAMLFVYSMAATSGHLLASGPK